MSIKVILLQILFPAFFLAVSGCEDQPSAQKNISSMLTLQASYNGIQFKMVHFEAAMPACAENSENKPCARMVAEYPLAISGPQRLQSFINDTVSYYVRESLSAFAPPREELLPSMDSIARRFIRDYKSFVEQNEHYGFTWEAETKGKILFQNEKVLSIALDSYSFTGGAHPNSFRNLINFDLKTLQRLRLEEVIIDQSRFKVRVEEAFRDYHGLEEGTDLNEAGFFWNQAFFLPANFAVKPGGLYLYYNNYEVAAYAVGYTELLISWDKLEGVIDQNRLF